MKTKKPKLIIFASGTKTGGGSGFQNLVEASCDGRLNADIVAVVSNIRGGGVQKRARRLHIPFVYLPKTRRTPEDHQRLAKKLAGKEYWVALSGCLWLVPMQEKPEVGSGLDPRRVFNIHPGPLSVRKKDGHPEFGGSGMYGHHVHEAVMRAFKDTKRIPRLRYTAVSMHFVTKNYDEGPLFFELPIPIPSHFDAEQLAGLVNMHEHLWQPEVTEHVIHERISWNGCRAESLVTPPGFPFLPPSERPSHFSMPLRRS